MSEANNGGRGDRAMAAGRAKGTASGNDEAVVGMCGVIRVICVIRLIRDSDTAGWGLSCPRMKHPMHFLQILAVNVRVNLRGRDIRMAQHLLNRPQIRTAFQQMRGKRMP